MGACVEGVDKHYSALYKGFGSLELLSGEPTPHRHQGTNAVQLKDDRINIFCPRLLITILMVNHREAIAKAKTGCRL